MVVFLTKNLGRHNLDLVEIFLAIKYLLEGKFGKKFGVFGWKGMIFVFQRKGSQCVGIVELKFCFVVLSVK